MTKLLPGEYVSFQKIDYKEFIYSSNKISDIEHVLLECRKTKSL